MGFTDRFIGKRTADGGIEGKSDPKSKKMLPAETSVIVDPSLGAEKHVPLESTYSPERLKEMESGLERLRQEIKKEGGELNKKLEASRSEEARGGDVNAEVLRFLEDRALLYDNLEAAFASASGGAPTRIEHAIDVLRKVASESSEAHRAKMDQVVETLRGLL